MKTKGEEQMKKRMTVILLAVLCAAACGWLKNGYDAQEAAMAAMERGERRGYVTAFVPTEAKAALIFYPGGLVDHAAYAPMMETLCERDVLCLLVEMPLDLAVLHADAADGMKEGWPDIDRWLIGGHSLGGAMAADYAAKHPQEFEGLILLGAYAAADLSKTEMKVLSVYGSEDGVMNREKYAEYLTHYPKRFKEAVIEGGNHAQFGDYGMQKGDGTAHITPEEQRKQTADAIAQMFGI